MASIEEVRAGIGQANDKAQESLGALQQAHSSLEQAQGLLQQTTDGSTQADVTEANGLLQQAISSIDESPPRSRIAARMRASRCSRCAFRCAMASLAKPST